MLQNDLILVSRMARRSTLSCKFQKLWNVQSQGHNGISIENPPKKYKHTLVSCGPVMLQKTSCIFKHKSSISQKKWENYELSSDTKVYILSLCKVGVGMILSIRSRTFNVKNNYEFDKHMFLLQVLTINHPDTDGVGTATGIAF